MTSRIPILSRATGNAPLVIAFMLFIALAIPNSILNLAWEYMHTELGQSYDALGVLAPPRNSGHPTTPSGRRRCRRGAARGGR